MPKISHLVAIFLVLGVVSAEFLPTINSKAYSQTQPTPTQSEILLSFLDTKDLTEVTIAAAPEEVFFISELSSIPGELHKIADDTNNIVSVNYTLSTSPLPTNEFGENIPAIIYNPPPTEDQPFIGNIIPPANSPLFDAYSKNGRAWYQEGNQVVVIFNNPELFRSFNQATGEETDWLQDRLSYDPIDSPNALSNYTTNYNGEIIAETDSWALVKFPSGGYLKISKPNAPLTNYFITQQSIGGFPQAL